MSAVLPARRTAALREVFAETLVELAREDPRLLLLDGDLANSTKADVFDRAFPDRLLQMGIAEQNMVGVAAGLATLGFVPWLSSFAAFLTHRAADQVRMVVAQTGLPVKIAGSYAGLLTGFTGKTHQDVEDLAIMRAMPNMTVLAPADGPEARRAIRFAHAQPGPVYVRLGRDPSAVLDRPERPFDPSAIQTLREGRDVALVSTGIHTTRVVEAAALLAREGPEVGVVHVPGIKPLNAEGLVAALAPYRLVITTEEHSVIGGLGGAVAETLAERDPKRVVRHGLEDTFGESGPNDALLAKYGLDAAGIARKVREVS